MNIETVGELKNFLNSVLDDLENYQDEEKLEMNCNTYGMYGNILHCGSCGFISLNNLKIKNQDEEDWED